MEDFAGIAILIFILVLWAFICRAVGLAAKEKGRSRVVWTILTFLPLGPIMGPLWLKSMPIAGEKPTGLQLTGRIVLILFLMGNASSAVLQGVRENQVAEKALEDYGIDSENVTAHYKQMSVNEIVYCLQLDQNTKTFQGLAGLDDETNQWLFATQDQVDKYNDILAEQASLECEERTYDYDDMSRAMKILEDQSDGFIRQDSHLFEQETTPTLEKNWREFSGLAYRANKILPIMLDESTRLDKLEVVQGPRLVYHHTLTEFLAPEVSQEDIETHLKLEVVNWMCEKEMISQPLELGGTYVYRYFGRDGGYIGNFEATVDDC